MSGQNSNRKQFKLTTTHISNIMEWVSKNEKYIMVLKEFICILSVANPAYLHIKNKFNKNLDLWTQPEKEHIRKLMEKAIEWQQRMIKEQRKNLCYAEKIHNSAVRHISKDKDGKIFISPRNLPKLMAIIGLDHEYQKKVKRDEENLCSDIKEYNDNICSEFDAIYEKSIKAKSM